MTRPLELEGVEARIGERVVLRDVSLRLEANERVALVGPNGVGKTTLLRVTVGLHPLAAGRVSALCAEPPSSGVGYLSQDPAAGLLPWYSARDNVLLPLRCQNASRATQDAALALVRERLDPRGDLDLEQYPRALSGGQAQLVGLMRALATSPRLLVCDEPFSAMDAPTRAFLRASLRDVCEEESGPALLFTTHDLDDMVELANRVVVIGGRPARIERALDPGEASARGVIGSALAEARR